VPGYFDALMEAERLSQLSDDDLFVELGRRVGDKERSGGDARALAFAGPFSATEQDMASGTLRTVGTLWWEKLEPKLMAVVCDPKNGDLKDLTGNRSLPQVAAGLATATVIATLAPPAWLIVLTTLLATKIVESGLEAVCQLWTRDREARRTAQT